MPEANSAPRRPTERAATTHTQAAAPPITYSAVAPGQAPACPGHAPRRGRWWAGWRVYGPPLPHLMLFYTAYILAGGFAQGLALIPGISITFWPPVGILIATLLLHLRSSWPWWIVASCLAELTCNAVWFHNPLPFALLYYAGNALEALTAAWLITQVSPGAFRLEAIEEVATFVVLGAGVAPMVSATVIAVTDAWRGKHPFTIAWPLVWLGDGTGVLVSTPLTVVAVQTWREWAKIPPLRLLETVILGVILLGVSTLAFNGYLPTAYMTLPPLLWIAVRFHLRGAATALGLLTVLTAIFTATGMGEFTGPPALQHDKIVMLQTFLGIAAISTLVVATLSLQRHQALRTLSIVNAALEARVEERTATLRESEERFRLAARATHDAIWDWDLATDVVTWGEGLATTFGHREPPPQGFTGAWWIAQIHPEDAGPVDAALKQALTSGADHVEVEYRLRRGDGTYAHVYDRGYILRDAVGAPVRLVGSIQDLTVRVQQAAALRDLNATLERRVTERTAALERAMAEQQRLEREARRAEHFALLGRLAAGVSHELRNPLAAVFLQVDLLAEELAQPSDNSAEAVAESLAEIKTNLARVEDLVEDYLSLARVATLERTVQDLGAALQGWAAEFQALATALGMTFRTEGLADLGAVAFHANTLRRALLNLVQNGLEAMTPGGTLTLRGRVTAAGDVEIQVADAGNGIPAAHLTHIFEPLHTTKPGGTGLGLYIVQEIVAAHGGQVTVESVVGQGTTFTFTLPRASHV